MRATNSMRALLPSPCLCVCVYIFVCMCVCVYVPPRFTLPSRSPFPLTPWIYPLSSLCLFLRCRRIRRPQHTATHCNTLQRTATLCNTLQHTDIVESRDVKVWDMNHSLICMGHVCDMTHSCVGHEYDQFMCDMTHSYTSHDSFIRVTWLIHMCDTTHSCHMTHVYGTCLIHVCDMVQQAPYWCVRYHRFMCVTWLIHAYSMTFSDDLFMCVTWLIHARTMSFQMTYLVCDMTYSCV